MEAKATFTNSCLHWIRILLHKWILLTLAHDQQIILFSLKEETQ